MKISTASEAFHEFVGVQYIHACSAKSIGIQLDISTHDRFWVLRVTNLNGLP